MLSALLLALAASTVSVSAVSNGRAHPNTPPFPLPPIASLPAEKHLAASAPVSKSGATIPPYNTTYYFDQLIDHTNPGLGTFKQRYWHTWEFYEEGG